MEGRQAARMVISMKNSNHEMSFESIFLLDLYPPAKATRCEQSTNQIWPQQQWPLQ